MSKSQRSVILAGVLLVSLLSPARAELPVTWVSASGDIASPCTRTLPCRDIGTAMNKTIAGGEIRALDSGPYVSVYIDKSISIVGTGIRIVPDPVFGISVRVVAGKDDVINLRGLIVDGGGTGHEGIYFESGAALHIQNSVIRGFDTSGIHFLSNYDSDLFVSDTLISDAAAFDIQNTRAAITIELRAPRTRVVLNRIRIENSQTGIHVYSNVSESQAASLLLRESIVSGNGQTGILIQGYTNYAPQIVVDRSTVVNNGWYGIDASFPATVHMSNSNVAGSGVGLYSGYGSALDLRPNNNIVGNVTNIVEPPSNQ
jgi:Right handed beta helix region